jgi:hypothetical protein
MIEHCKRVMKQRGIEDGAWLEEWSVRNHDHLTNCSCWMCGNARHYYGEATVQERRRAQDNLRASLEE